MARITRKGVFAGKLLLLASILTLMLVSVGSSMEGAEIENSLVDIIASNPDIQITVVVALKTNNEGMLDEIRQATSSLDAELNTMSDNLKEKYKAMNQELGYYTNEDGVLNGFADGDVQLMAKLAELQVKYGLDAASLAQISPVVDDLTNQKIGIITEILHARYTPIQTIFINELNTIPSAQVVYQNLLTNTVTVQLKASDVGAVAALSHVDEIVYGEWKDTNELSVSMPTVGAPTWHSNGFTGTTSIPLFLNSDSVNFLHPDLDHIDITPGCFFSGCILLNTSSAHDTLVVGVIGSDNTVNKGVAYGIDKLYAAQTNNFPSAQEAINWGLVNLSQAFKADMVTMSKTWNGGTTPFCGSEIEERYVDEIVDTYDVNWIKSAGNNGGNATYDGVTLPAGAYNILAVGASDDKNTISRINDIIWSGSSLGPVSICNSAETRIKPDITAPGKSITGPAASSSQTWTGTSFAAPHVTGSIVLIDQKTSKLLSSEEIRALLLNSAEDRLQSTGASGNDGPDNTWGYGYLDMNKAYFDIGGVDKATLTNVTKKFFKFDFVDLGETATMVWNRHIVGNAGFTNNLDLYLYDEATNTLIDSSEYVGRNIEHVIADGIYNSTVVKVTLTSLNTGSSEDFGIAVDGAINDTNLPTLSVIMNTSQNVFCGSNKNLTVSVKNNGPIAAHNVNVNINLPSGVTLVTGANPQNLGTIIVGETKTASWKIKQTSITPVIISTSIDSNSYGEQILAGASINSSCKSLGNSGSAINVSRAKVCKKTNATNATC